MMIHLQKSSCFSYNISTVFLNPAANNKAKQAIQTIKILNFRLNPHYQGQHSPLVAIPMILNLEYGL